MTALWLLVVMALLAESYVAGEIFIPLIVSLFLAILLEPVVSWGQARGLRRGRLALACVLLFALAACGAIWACSQPFSKIVSDFPKYESKIRAGAAAVQRRVRPIQRSTDMVQKTLHPGQEQSRAPKPAASEAWTQWLWRGLGSFVQAAGIAVFVPFLMAFALAEKELLQDALARLAADAWDVEYVENETGRMVRAFFYGNLVVGLSMGGLHWLVFMVIGLKNAAGLGLITGFLTIVPILGLPAALALPLAQGLLQFDDVMPFVVMVAGLTVVHLFTNNYVIPRLIGAKVKINATAATVGLLFWGWLWGIVGFLLAVPLTALIKIVLESNKDTAPAAGLLATRPREFKPWFVWRPPSRRHAVPALKP